MLLMAAARPGETLQQLAELPIGARDQALLALRCENFGPGLPAYVDCPACSTRLEFALDGEALRCEHTPACIEADGIRVRPPNSRDLALALKQHDLESAVRCLARRCVMSDHDQPERDLTPEEIGQMEAVLAEADSAADIVLNFSCEQCGHEWPGAFDIAGYLWQEIDAHACRLLNDIHLLARAYGWTERDVLALSDERRAAYINRVTA
ncbi:hypothetical protein QU481_15525 [Crenobacter sp. SG2303]|uniref:Uncharacterized protein n=1 Tax=Crenobacter oryzisoli TaxID=3056844 RepID=A0ABT7XMT8_9NEIS|nr:hypothetical protein [Crenobacter sp. SG2303]MDN0075097.1 hypothetical protein [Crenobacter sp. SG2303]MDN0076295.1 hypothetical protein [Crenobacter sp. SG2303]